MTSLKNFGVINYKYNLSLCFMLAFALCCKEIHECCILTVSNLYREMKLVKETIS